MTLKKIVVNIAFLATIGASLGGFPNTKNLESAVTESGITVEYDSEALSRKIYPKIKATEIDTDGLIDILNEKYAKSITDDSPYTLTSDIMKVLDKPFYLSLMFTESRNDPNAKSPTNAKGLGQFLKPAWDMVDKENDYYTKAYDPGINITNIIRYTVFLYDNLGKTHPGWGELTKEEKQNHILAAYNGGHGRLQECGFNIRRMPKESRDYVDKQQGRFPILVKKELYSRIQEDPELYRQTVKNIESRLKRPIFIPESKNNDYYAINITEKDGVFVNYKYYSIQ